MAGSWATARRAFRPSIIEGYPDLSSSAETLGLSGASPHQKQPYLIAGRNIDVIDNKLIIIDYISCSETLSLPPRKNDASRYFSVSSRRCRTSSRGHAKVSLLEHL